jgi:hypothetical protein
MLKKSLPVFALCSAMLLGGCVVPNHMHVSEGLRPDLLDKNVRFQTTYYFRTFDYCWKESRESNSDYRQIIPETDTLYRFRMTGKASALGSRIRFESGTLQESEISPFGHDIRLDPETNGFVVRSQAELKAERAAAQQARQLAATRAERDAALPRFRELVDVASAIAASDARPEAKEAAAGQLKAAMGRALDLYTGGNVLSDAEKIQFAKVMEALEALRKEVAKPSPAALSDAEKAAFDKVTTELKAIGDKVSALSPPTSGAEPAQKVAEAAAKASASLFAEQVKDVVARIEKALANDVGKLRAQCIADGRLQRGFQIMGPEGARPFDPNERLLMVMHSSAEPLIETLQEYSGRMIAGQMSRADRLLPLTEASLRVMATERALDGLQGRESYTVEDVFDKALASFRPAKAPAAAPAQKSGGAQ